MTHFSTALTLWNTIQKDILQFGRECRLAIEQEDKTIRDISVALCGNASLEDRIGRYVLAAQFADSLNPCQYGQVSDWLTATHYTELAKIERAFDHEYALDIMQDLVTENSDGSVNVRPVEWLRGKRGNEEMSKDEVIHRYWMRTTRILAELMGELERLGNDATKHDRRIVRLLKLMVRTLQAQVKEKA